MNDVIRFWNCITSPGTAIPAITGMVIGISIGMFFSRPCFKYLLTRWKQKRKDRKEEEQEKKQTALRRLESRKARAEEQERIYKENVKFLVDSINKVMQDFSEKNEECMKSLEAKEELVKEIAQLLWDTVVKVERKLENREIMEEFVISPMFDAIREKIKELGEW